MVMTQSTSRNAALDVQAALEHLIQETEQKLKQANPNLLPLFRQCFLNTIETTVELLDDDTTFVITGDIPAMWLRDSTAQVRHYLRLAKDDSSIRRVIRGMIRRQVQHLLIDPYANAFNQSANGHGHQTDKTQMHPAVWERKYELDSLCYPVQLIKDYVDATQDRSIFDENLHQMLRSIISVMQTEQRHDEQSSYSFERLGKDHPQSDTLPFDGKGTRTNFTGMVWSGFRPSDDACKFGYLVPANMFAVVILQWVIDFARDIYHDETLVKAAEKLRAEIHFGIQTYAIVNHPKFGHIYAYETDGYGNYNLMDDANVPSLLSLPYLGYCSADDPLYCATRAFILSDDNPYFFRGSLAEGVGSPHTERGYIWHIGITMQALTSTDPAEQNRLIDMLIATTAGTNFMHESFDPNQPENYSRSWFAWANSLFAEFILRWLNSSAQSSQSS